jgi:hypothetical protein
VPSSLWIVVVLHPFDPAMTAKQGTEGALIQAILFIEVSPAPRGPKGIAKGIGTGQARPDTEGLTR